MPTSDIYHPSRQLAVKNARAPCRASSSNEGKGSLEMAAVSSGRSVMDPNFETQNGLVDRLKALYPAVNEEKTPLPRAWSPKEKYNYIGLSQNNLRVHYKGKFFFQGLG